MAYGLECASVQEDLTPDAIARTVLDEFDLLENPRPTPDAIERVMRPFGVISTAVGIEVMDILLNAGKPGIATRFAAWVEANIIALGDGDDREQRTEWFLRDPCDCVLYHLPNALKFAQREVDPRVLQLISPKSSQES